MTLKTLKPKANNSLILDDEFLQYCELNNIEDVQKLAKETFKKGFDMLKYGDMPTIVSSPIPKKYTVKEERNHPKVEVKDATLYTIKERIVEKNDLYSE